MSAILVTGASGFIGHHVVRTLLARGKQPRCFVRPTSNVQTLEEWGVELVYGDINNVSSIFRAARGCEAIFHVAACVSSVNSRDFYVANTEGTKNVLDAAIASRMTPPKLVYFSSLAAAGPARNKVPLTTASPLHSVSHYGKSKLRAEFLARSYADRMPISIVRPPIVFGEYDHASLALFSMVAKAGLFLLSDPFGKRRYSIIHASDLAALALDILEKGKRLLPATLNDATPEVTDASGIYFAAAEQDVAYAQLGRMIGKAFGRKRVRMIPMFKRAPYLVGAVATLWGKLMRRTPYLTWDKAHEICAGEWICSPQEAEEELGFQTAAPLQERIRQTALWYCEEGWLPFTKERLMNLHRANPKLPKQYS